MANVVVGCMCVQSTIAEGTGIMQIQPKPHNYSCHDNLACFAILRRHLASVSNV